MNKEKILILGSKPNIKIPSLDFKKIYSSNASAEIANKYQKKYNHVPHTCIVGAKNFIKLPEIKKRIIDSNPDTLIIRSFKNIYREHFNYSFDRKFIYNNEQIAIQKNFLRNGTFDLILSEINYEISLKKKINHIIRCFLNNEFLGFSTGLFAALYALTENKNSDVILCGIGLKGGDHYYQSGSMTENRGRVDRMMFNKIKNEYLEKIFFSDDDIDNSINLNKISSKDYITLNEL